MRRFYIAGSFIAILLVCSIAPPPLEAGSGGKFEPAPVGRFTGQTAIIPEFPSFLQAGSGTAASNDTIYDIPSCTLRQYVSAQQTDIVLLKARSSNFNLDPNFAPLAGLYYPRQRADSPATFPYSLMPVPMDGQFHYQATYVRDPFLPTEFAFLCTDQLGFPHPDIPPGTGEERTVRWDYRFGVTPKMDMKEALHTHTLGGDPRIASDADQDPETVDDHNGAVQWVNDTQQGWFERSLFYGDKGNRDQEDMFYFWTGWRGQLYVQLETGNGTYSTWDVTVTLYDQKTHEVIGRASGSGANLSLQVPTGGYNEKETKEDSRPRQFYVQIYGRPKDKTPTSNVYYLPYRISFRHVRR